MLLSYATVDFYLFYDGAADMPLLILWVTDIHANMSPSDKKSV